MDEGLLGLVRELDEQGKPIAFICHGGWVAASSRAAT
jgi:putative intracellular protease/amidase